MQFEFENDPTVYIMAFSVEPRRVVRAELAFHTPGVPDYSWVGTAALTDPEERAAICGDATNYAEVGHRMWLSGWYDITAPTLF